VVVSENATQWRLEPEKEWTAGTYSLEINPELEDLAGNSIARPFEVDIEGQVQRKQVVERVRLPIKIK
jgi:hypothetical protein